MPTVHLLDYVAGNVRSLVNAIEKVGYEVAWIKTPEEVKNADVQTTPVTPEVIISKSILMNALRHSSSLAWATLATASNSFPLRASCPP